jgi:hypothetical protein
VERTTPLECQFTPKSTLFQSCFYSDDGERYDSETEGGTQTRRGREYRDKDSDSLDSTEKRDHNSSKPSTPARTKPTASVKKIDLGAAAHYGRGPHSLVSWKSRYNIPVCFFTL